MAKKKSSTKVKKAKKKAKKKVVVKKKKPAAKAKKKAVVKAKKKAAPKKVKKSSKKKSAAPKSKTATKVKSSAAAASSSVALGTTPPEMNLSNQKGEVVNLPMLLSSSPKAVLYFYPKDDTPGCTTEACNFRDSLNRLQSAGALVVGVSPDSVESHVKFIEKYQINFDLLSDTDHKLCEAMGVWKEKSFMGRNYMGVERSTFLFVEGKVAKVWQPVKVEGHVDEVLAAIDAA